MLHDATTHTPPWPHPTPTPYVRPIRCPCPPSIPSSRLHPAGRLRASIYRMPFLRLPVISHLSVCAFPLSTTERRFLRPAWRHATHEAPKAMQCALSFIRPFVRPVVRSFLILFRFFCLTEHISHLQSISDSRVHSLFILLISYPFAPYIHASLPPSPSHLSFSLFLTVYLYFYISD